MSEHEKKRSGRRGRSTANETGTLSLLLKAAGKALPLTAAVGALLLVLATALLLKTGDPGRYAAIVGTALLYPTAALFGMLTARFSRGTPPLFGGLVAGGVLLAVLLLMNLLLPHGADAYGRPLIVGLYATVPIAALGGALFSARRPARKRKKPKRAKAGR